jgi:hypothetical protein
MCVRLFPPGGLDPVLDGGEGDEDPVVAPEVPAGGLVGQAVFGDQADSPLLDTARVLTVRQSQVGNITGEAAATAGAAMAGEGDDQIDGAIGPGISEVMEGTASDGIAAGAMATARAGARRPIAAAPLEAGLGQVFGPSGTLGDIRNILPWTSHRLLS